MSRTGVRVESWQLPQLSRSGARQRRVLNSEQEKAPRAKSQEMERIEQTKLMAQCALFEARFPELLWIYAVPNGGKRSRIEGAKMRAEGLKAGVSDVHLAVARRGYHSLFIEMKQGSNEPTESQLAFQAWARSQGNLAVVCWGWEAAWEVVLWYLGVAHVRPFDDQFECRQGRMTK
jgi:hypothetical protein